MKAALFYGPGDIRVKDVSDPRVGEDEVLVRVKAVGICGSDLHVYHCGMFEDLGRRVNNGLLMGHEVSGEIVEVGSKVKKFGVGDRIAAVSRGGGSFAEYVALPAADESLTLLPAHVSFSEGATIEPLATSIHGTLRGQPAPEETVVILGVGVIGLGCLQVIRATVPCRVIAVDSSPLRLGLAKRLGADAIVNLTETDPLEAVIELTGGALPLGRFQVRGGNADLVIDCAGAKLSSNQGLYMLKKRNGRLVMVALYEHVPEFDFNQVVLKHVNVYGSWSWTGDDFRQGLDLVQKGRIDRKVLISHEYPLDEAPMAFAMQNQVEASIKVLLKP